MTKRTRWRFFALAIQPCTYLPAIDGQSPLPKPILSSHFFITRQSMITEDIRDYFQCGVCMQHFNERDKCPRVLMCGHTFCERCIALIIDQQRAFKCPVCNCQLGSLRLGQTYKNFSLLKLMSLNGIEKSEGLSHTIKKETYEEIVGEMDRLPKNIERLVIIRTKDDEQNPFDFDLIRSNKQSMRFFRLLVTFQKLKHYEMWVKYSAHGFEECLADSLVELKALKTVKIVNAYDKYGRMRDVIPLTANEEIAFEIQIKQW